MRGQRFRSHQRTATGTNRMQQWGLKAIFRCPASIMVAVTTSQCGGPATPFGSTIDNGSIYTQQCGAVADVPSADFSCVNILVPAIFRPSSGTWWIFGQVPIQWG